ncbi:DUF4352 domain-containing protein [bacterium]|nr:DUF4352 domain-containing protein [bacterium]
MKQISFLITILFSCLLFASCSSNNHLSTITNESSLNVNNTYEVDFLTKINEIIVLSSYDKINYSFIDEKIQEIENSIDKNKNFEEYTFLIYIKERGEYSEKINNQVSFENLNQSNINENLEIRNNEIKRMESYLSYSDVFENKFKYDINAKITEEKNRISDIETQWDLLKNVTQVNKKQDNEENEPDYCSFLSMSQDFYKKYNCTEKIYDKIISKKDDTITIEYSTQILKNILGDSLYFQDTSDEGMTYLIFDMDITNNGYEEFNTNSFYFKVIVNNVKYDIAWVAYLENRLKNVDLLDKGKISGQIAFEVPENVDKFELKYEAWTDYNVEYIEKVDIKKSNVQYEIKENDNFFLYNNLKNIFVSDEVIPSNWYIQENNNTGYYIKKTYARPAGINNYQYVSIKLMRYESITEANSKYTEIIAPIQKARGYTDLNIKKSITCKGFNFNSGTNKIVCYDKNIIILVDGWGTMIYPETVEEFLDWQLEAVKN